MHMSCVWLYRLYTLSCYSCIPCFYCICNMCPLFSTPSMKLWSKQSFTCPAFSKCWNSTWRQLTMSICLGGACKCGICTMMTNIPSIAFQQSACVDWHHIFAAARANIHSKISLSPWLVKDRNRPPSSSQDLWMQPTSASNPMACRTGSSQMEPVRAMIVAWGNVVLHSCWTHCMLPVMLLSSVPKSWGKHHVFSTMA